MKRLFVILTFKSIVYSHSIETSFVKFISKDCTKKFFFIFEGIIPLFWPLIIIRVKIIN